MQKCFEFCNNIIVIELKGLKSTKFIHQKVNQQNGNKTGN